MQNNASSNDRQESMPKSRMRIGLADEVNLDVG